MTEAVGPVALILAAMFSFAVQDIAVKLMAGEVSLWQLMVVRSTAAMGLVAICAALLRRGASLVPSRWGWPLVRAFAMSGAHVFLYAAIAFLPVTTATAAFFTSPLIIALMAALFLRESLGPRRIVAVVAGFAGVLVIVRPGSAEFEPATLLPVAAAFCYALGTIITRLHCREDSNLALVMLHNLLYANLGLLGLLLVPGLISGSGGAPLPSAGASFVASGWLHPSPLAAGLMLLTAFTHVLSMLLVVRAYQSEDAAKLAPFEYTYLIFIPLFEFAIWRVWPDGHTLTGMAMIVGAGAFVSWRERVSARSHPGAPPPPRDGEARR